MASLSKQLQTSNSVQIIDNTESWQSTLDLCFKPLVQHNFQPKYIDAVKK